jgi:uncharacterized phage protein gp47/JayE
MAILDLIPLFTETVDSIRGRIDADMNAGVDPADPAFIDTSEGGIAWDLTQPFVIEVARFYDALGTEVPASVIPLFAYGEYLDYWGEVIGLPRKDEAPAVGVVRFVGTVGELVAPGTQVATLQSDPSIEPSIFEVTDTNGTIPGAGYIDLNVQATEPGVVGNVAAGTVTVLLTPNPEITAVTNLASISGGVEVESDEAYNARIMLEFQQPAGAGNQADYVRWALAHPGVSHATAQGLWNGPGTVLVTITDENNDPLSTTVVDELQAELDPVAQRGAGTAPVGALVTVATPTLLTINISATVSFEQGYSLDGASGTIPLRQPIIDSIAEYVEGLPAGQEVVYGHVEARFFQIEGVHDVTNLLVNGVTTNITLSPQQIPDLGSVTLT